MIQLEDEAFASLVNSHKRLKKDNIAKDIIIDALNEKIINLNETVKELNNED